MISIRIWVDEQSLGLSAVAEAGDRVFHRHGPLAGEPNTVSPELVEQAKALFSALLDDVREAAL